MFILNHRNRTASARKLKSLNEVWHSAVKNASLDQSPCSDTVELGGVGGASVSESALSWAERAELNKDTESQRGLIHLSAQSALSPSSSFAVAVEDAAVAMVTSFTFKAIIYSGMCRDVLQ